MLAGTDNRQGSPKGASKAPSTDSIAMTSRRRQIEEARVQKSQCAWRSTILTFTGKNARYYKKNATCTPNTADAHVQHGASDTGALELPSRGIQHIKASRYGKGQGPRIADGVERLVLGGDDWGMDGGGERKDIADLSSVSSPSQRNKNRYSR
jgi:hypothetical protein